MSEMDEFFRARVYLRREDTEPYMVSEPFLEPVEAVDVAEGIMRARGIVDQSYAALVFNGDEEIHAMLFYLKDGIVGILNTERARWPVFMLGESDAGTVLSDSPWEVAGGNATVEDSSNKEKDDDAEVMKIEEHEDEPEDEEDDDWDDEGDDEDEIEPDVTEDEDAEDDTEPEEGDEGDEDSEEGEEEAEMPRLKIFGKFRGPKGWRKRAETDHEKDMNFMGVTFGVLDEDAAKPAAQEKDKRVVVEFREFDLARKRGELRIKVPAGVEFHRKGKWLHAEIPYYDEEN